MHTSTSHYPSERRTEMSNLDHLLQMWRSADADVRDAEMERHEIENDITAEFSRLADDAKRLSEETGKEVKPQTFAKGPGVEVTCKPTIEWQKSLDGPLAVLAEVMPPADFEKLLTKQAEPKPPPPRQFNMTAVKQYEDKGDQYAIPIAKARTVHAAQAKPREVNNLE